MMTSVTDCEAPDQDGNAVSTEKARNPRRIPMNALDAVVSACFDASITPQVERKLRRRGAIAVIIRAPTGAWVKPLSRLFGSRYGDPWQLFLRDGSERTQTATTNCDTVATALSKGQPVAGIAADPKILPYTLTGAADVIIVVRPPGGADIAVAIARFLAKPRQGAIPDEAVAGLDLMDIVSTFRAGSTSAQIVARLRATSAIHRGAVVSDRVPDLVNAVEFGRARDWGLALARDIADYRAGKLSWTAVDRGAILYSEPGMGKSLYARMLSNACNVPLVASSVADWFVQGGGYLNSVINSSRMVFARAAALAPCILFLDEIDAIPNRATLSERNRDYWTPLINDILVNLDNAVSGQREGVVVIGATNNIAAVDLALIRPGRLERGIEVERPNADGVRNILRHHLGTDLKDADLFEIAGLLEHTTGAEIMQAVRCARRLARHANRELVLDDLRAAALPPLEISSEALWRICVHEAGHVVASFAIPHGTVIRCVIGIKGGLGARTIVDYRSDDLPTVEALEAQVSISLSGRVAERVILGSVSVAAGDEDSDLANATRLIATLHACAGLGDTIAYLSAGTDALASVRWDAGLRRSVERHLHKLQRRTFSLIKRHRAAVVIIAEALRVRKHLSGEELRKLFKSATLEPAFQRRIPFPFWRR